MQDADNQDRDVNINCQGYEFYTKWKVPVNIQ